MIYEKKILYLLEFKFNGVGTQAWEVIHERFFGGLKIIPNLIQFIFLVIFLNFYPFNLIEKIRKKQITKPIKSKRFTKKLVS